MLYRSKPLYNRDLVGTFFQILIVIVSGFVLAIISLSQTPLAALLVALILPALLLVLKRPEVAFLVMIFMTSTIISEDKNPLLFEIGSGRVFLTELILGVLLGLIVLRWIVEPDFDLVRTPLDIPLLGFIGFSFLSTYIALSKVVPPSTTFAAFINTPPEEVSLSIGALRGLVYYLTFFLATNLIRNKEQVKLLITAFKILAIIVAVFMITQQIFPSVAIFPPEVGVRVETLGTEGITYTDIVRVTRVPGEALLVTICIVTLVELITDGRTGRQITNWISLLVIGTAIVISFNRNFWIIILISMILKFLFDSRRIVKQIGRIILVSAVILGLIYSLVGIMPDSRVTRILNAAEERFVTVFELDTYGTDESTSFGYRVIEARYGLASIKEHLFFGVGPGQRYRVYDPRLDWQNYDGRTYMHNSHIWTIVQIGIWGYLCLLWFSVVFLARGVKYLRKVSDNQLQNVMIGFYLTYFGILIASIVNPILLQSYWIPVIAVMVGTNEAILRLSTQNELGATS